MVARPLSSEKLRFPQLKEEDARFSNSNHQYYKLFKGHRPTIMNWDVFISHATEDKEAVARPLAKALEGSGLRVWFDEFTLVVGDKLRQKIDFGLANSRFGIAILSPHFFKKKWPQAELDGLFSRENSELKVILPVWRDLTPEILQEFSPLMADRLAVKWNGNVDQVVAELLRAIKQDERIAQPLGENPKLQNSPAHISHAHSKEMIADLATEVFQRIQSGERRVIEELHRERKELRHHDMQLLFDQLILKAARVVSNFRNACRNVTAQLTAVASSVGVRNCDYPWHEDADDFANSFVVFSSIHEVAIPYISAENDDPRNWNVDLKTLRVFDRTLIHADTELENLFKRVATCHVLSPHVAHGETTQQENSTYPRSSGRFDGVIKDTRKELFEDNGLVILKRAFSRQFGKFRVVKIAKERSRQHKHVVVNPYACYWSGEVDYDEVVYHHFFRWHLALNLSGIHEGCEVGSFNIAALEQPTECDI